MNAVHSYLDDFHYKQAIKAIEHCLEKYIELMGDMYMYMGKLSFFPNLFTISFVRSGTSWTSLLYFLALKATNSAIK